MIEIQSEDHELTTICACGRLKNGFTSIKDKDEPRCSLEMQMLEHLTLLLATRQSSQTIAVRPSQSFSKGVILVVSTC